MGKDHRVTLSPLNKRMLTELTPEYKERNNIKPPLGDWVNKCLAERFVALYKEYGKPLPKELEKPKKAGG